MAENNIGPKVQKPRCAIKRCLIRALLGLALLASIGFAASFYFPRESIAPQAQDSHELDALKQRLDALEIQVKNPNQVPSAAQTTDNTASLNGEILKLKNEVENKSSQNERAAQKLIAAAFAFWDLREEARQGHAFAPQLSALLAASADNPEVSEAAAKLSPYASEGVPTVPLLNETLAEEENTAPPPRVDSDSATMGERIKMIFRPLISVRPLHDKRFSALNKALDSNDAPQALEAFNALPEDLRKDLAGWQAKLEARIDLDATLKALTAHFTTLPAQRTVP